MKFILYLIIAVYAAPLCAADKPAPKEQLHYIKQLQQLQLTTEEELSANQQQGKHLKSKQSSLGKQLQTSETLLEKQDALLETLQQQLKQLNTEK